MDLKKVKRLVNKAAEAARKMDVLATCVEEAAYRKGDGDYGGNAEFLEQAGSQEVSRLASRQWKSLKKLRRLIREAAADVAQ